MYLGSAVVTVMDSQSCDSEFKASVQSKPHRKLCSKQHTPHIK